jgi:hypothetical protein
MKTKTIVLLLFAICGTLFLGAIALCAGFLFVTYRNLDTSISPTIDQLFAAVDNDSFAETYDTHTTPEYRKVTTRKQHEDIGLTIKTRLGSLKSKTLRRFNGRQLNSNTYTEVVYQATFDKGSGTITATFKKEGERSQLVGFHVHSPEFQKDLVTGKCPHCGEPHTSNAKFCPKCGKPLAKDEEKSAPSILNASAERE